MLHRAVQQFLADVYWGDLDVLLMDLPPGTGDVAISVAQLVPTAELLVVTTPQVASAEVAERAGAIAVQTHQRIAGVIENMSGFACPHCGEVARRVRDRRRPGRRRRADPGDRHARCPSLGQVPIDIRLRQGGDEGIPLVLSAPDSAAAQQLTAIAGTLVNRARGLAGRSLGLSPV